MLFDTLPFDQIRYFERCSLVEHGEIIQISDGNQIATGMRTYYSDAMGGKEAILIIGGADHGALISLDDIGNPPALAVTDMVRFVAKDIAPFNPHVRQPTVGNLLQLDGALIGRSQVIHPGGVTQPAYVYLTNDQAKQAKGACTQSLSFVNLRGISRSFDLELKPEPLKVVGAA
jgi:hypothetical protein